MDKICNSIVRDDIRSPPEAAKQRNPVGKGLVLESGFGLQRFWDPEQASTSIRLEHLAAHRTEGFVGGEAVRASGLIKALPPLP